MSNFAALLPLLMLLSIMIVIGIVIYFIIKKSSGPQQLLEYDSGHVGWCVLSFFFPLVGLILYLVWRQQKPACAKMCLRGLLTYAGLMAIYFAIIMISALLSSI